MNTDIYTYTPEMGRPSCPVCGAPVNTPDSEGPWVGQCGVGHVHVFQLDVDDEVEDNE